MNKTSLVLTVLGPDHPGVVDTLAQTVAAHGGNWIESRMAHLAGQFAGILRVEVAAASATALTEAIQQLTGLQAVIATDAQLPTPPATPTVQLSLVGQDRPGIVREISHVLSTHGVNVEELHSTCRRAANSGQQLFEARASLQLPAGLATESLRQALEAVAGDMMVDIVLE